MFERQHAAAAGLFLLLSLVSLPHLAHATEMATAPDDSSYNESVVVTASRYDDNVHLSHTNVTSLQLDALRTAVDVPMMLQDIPGVYSYSDAASGLGYSYLKIRGFDQKRVAVLVNGIPLNDPESHEVYWVDLPDFLSSVQDVQVQRGIANGVSGVTAIGGAVNMVTNVLDDEPGGLASIETGSYGTNRRMIRYQTGELGGGFASMLRLSQVESEGYRDRSGSEQWAVYWSGRWRNDAHAVQANFYTGKELSHHAWDGVAEADLEANRRHNPETYWNAVDDFRQPHYELHWDWQLADNLHLRNTAYHIFGEGFYENFKKADEGDDPDPTTPEYSLDVLFPDLYASADAVDVIRQKWVRKHQTGWVPAMTWYHPGGQLVLGGDYYTFHSKHWGDVLWADAGTGGQALTPGMIPDGSKYHDFTGDKDAWSVYFNDRWEFMPGLTLMTELQYQHRQYDFMQEEVGNFTGTERNAYTVEYDFWNPKGGLFWDVPGEIAGARVGVYGHVGMNHREPADSDYWGVWAGPDDLGENPLFATSEVVYEDGEAAYTRWSDPTVEEEKVINYEGGVSVRGDGLQLTFNYYYMDFENEIVDTGIYDPQEGRSVRANAESTIHKGLELGLRWQMTPNHGLALAGSRSWNEYESFVFTRPAQPGDPGWNEDPELNEAYDQAVDNSGKPIARFPDWLLSATLESQLGPVTSRLRLRHVGQQYLDPTGDEDRTIDAYTTVDLALFADLGAIAGERLVGFEGFLRLNNLFDEEYETWGYYDGWGAGNYYIPGVPRHLMTGVNYTF